jgi:hypothetical protein
LHENLDPQLSVVESIAILSKTLKTYARKKLEREVVSN